ncbi:ATP-binding cassette domain-containing protein [Bifidobacterium bombi]|uniref:ABC transporter, ATP-binding protein n=3 Tax=Bifidobacterium bombi TaxID=471511 RepID=A0A080N1T8_9BIFI|nr:ABC transporter ATP-binding protein [Bifidobacterium bombi]KFF30802.1 ABC transporter, ATP-binding protein [Bifidobacterium bombi DSM 19703]
MTGKRVIAPRKVEFADFSVRYGKRTVLDVPSGGFDLSGQTIGLFGPNGAGKTTMMRSMVGLINRFSGTLSAPDLDSISYVPDVPYLYRFLNIGECIRLFVSRYADFDSDKAERLVNHLGLPLDRPLGSFSKGQSEQLHLVLSFSRDCSLYVLDEPLAAVDPYTRDELLSVIKQSAGKDSTIVMSTHIISEVDSMFTHVIMINDGRIVANDSVERFKKDSGSLEQAFKDRMARR